MSQGYNAKDHDNTNRRIDGEHDLNDIYVKVENLTNLAKLPPPEKTWIQKYGAYLVALIVPVLLAFAGYVTMGNTVEQLVKDNSKKADKQAVQLQFKNVDNRIDGVIKHHEDDNSDTKEDLKDLGKKMDKVLEIIIDISRDVNKNK